jgi:hypothetical protein
LPSRKPTTIISPLTAAASHPDRRAVLIQIVALQMQKRNVSKKEFQDDLDELMQAYDALIQGAGSQSRARA